MSPFFEAHNFIKQNYGELCQCHDSDVRCVIDGFMSQHYE